MSVSVLSLVVPLVEVVQSSLNGRCDAGKSCCIGH